MNRYYILVNKQVFPVTNVMTWAQSFENDDRRVNLTKFTIIKKRKHLIKRKQLVLNKKRPSIKRLIIQCDRRRKRKSMTLFGEVSTVFLGLDHSFGESDPMLFETMIFGGKYNEYCNRSTTWDQATEMHHFMVKMVHNNC